MVAIIKYNSGNVQSVQYALQRLGVESVVTDDESVIRTANKVIFPGVGHAASAMKYLKDKVGLGLFKNCNIIDIIYLPKHILSVLLLIPKMKISSI